MGRHEITFSLIEGETAESLLEKLQKIVVGMIILFSVDSEKPDIVTYVIEDAEFNYIHTAEDELIGGYYEDDGTWINFEDYGDEYGE